jgi:hypothetical protein
MRNHSKRMSHCQPARQNEIERAAEEEQQQEVSPQLSRGRQENRNAVGRLLRSVPVRVSDSSGLRVPDFSLQIFTRISVTNV